MEVRLIENKELLESVEMFKIENLLWGTEKIAKTYGYIGFVPGDGLYIKLVCEEKNPLRIYKKDQDPVYKDSAMEAFFQFKGNDTAADDIIKYILKPTGPFCPQLTLVTMLAGVMYGCMYYKKKLTLPRVLITKFIVMLVCNVFLNTLCLTVLYGQAFMVILPARALKNLIMWPIDSVIFFATAKALESIGAFRFVRRAQAERIARS